MILSWSASVLACNEREARKSNRDGCAPVEKRTPKIMTVQQTLADLVAIDSVSSRSNAEVISYLEQRCARRAFDTQRFVYVDEAGNEKVNLVAVAGGDSKALSAPDKSGSAGALQIELALVGHTDTVPYDSAWAEALHLTERDGKLLGRGACDTKGFIAAALTTIETIDLAKLKRPFALCFTCDEEIGCLGAKRLAAARPFTARYAIVGEPTSLQPMRAGKGYALAEVLVRGREAHSAYPQLGASAIFRAAQLIQRIERIAEAVKTGRHEDFDPPYTTLNVGLINGGSAKNVVAGECGFTLEWRTIPGQPSTYVLNLVKEAVADLQKEDREFFCDIDAGRFDESFETPSRSRLVKFLEQSSSRVSGTVAFGTEAPSMISLGAEAVVFGPGDIRVAHRTGEFVPRGELDQCVKILQEAIDNFCL
jgi:acetylornithine deacetylase